MIKKHGMFTIDLNGEGGVCLYGVGGEIVTVHDDGLNADREVILRVKDAVRIAYVLDCVPFEMTEAASAVYKLSSWFDTAPTYYDAGINRRFAWKMDGRTSRYRLDFKTASRMFEDGLYELKTGYNRVIFGKKAAVSVCNDGTFVVTHWCGNVEIVTSSQEALVLAGFSIDVPFTVDGVKYGE